MAQLPLLIEIKDQDGAMGPNVGPLEYATAEALKSYRGPVAVMSFNPHAVAAFERLLPGVTRGLVTCAYNPLDWPLLPPRLPAIICAQSPPITNRSAPASSPITSSTCTIPGSRNCALPAPPILCWTVTSPEIEAEARKVVDNITFEGYLAAL